MTVAATALVAVDGSDASVEAIQTARRLFGVEATLTVAHVAEIVPITPPLTPGLAPVATGTAMHPDPAESVQSATDVARRTAVEADASDAEIVGAVGDPADTIVELAEARHVDVIVVGSHEHGWLSKLFTRSVADAVRQRSTIPVLVVPALAERNDEPDATSH